MALTPSNMLPLGTQAPDFTLPDGNGTQYSLASLQKPNGLLVVFMSNHCPYVIHLAEGLARLSREIGDHQIGMVGINSNDVAAYPADSPAKMVEEVAMRGYEFPYLFDESQAIAKAYDAACTPDFYLFDGEGKLVYRGRFDESSPGNGKPVTGEDLYAAIKAVAQGKPVAEQQHPSMGCNVKWR